jgi:hypothetical protein
MEVVMKTFGMLSLVALGLGMVMAAIFVLGMWALMADFKTLKPK